MAHDSHGGFWPSLLDLRRKLFAGRCTAIEDCSEISLFRQVGAVKQRSSDSRYTSLSALASYWARATYPPITVTFSFMINFTASLTFQCLMYTILDPPWIALISHDRLPVTWKRGIESKTVRCGSVGLGRGGRGWPARSAALKGAGHQDLDMDRDAKVAHQRSQTRDWTGPFAVYSTQLWVGLQYYVNQLHGQAVGTSRTYPDVKNITASLSGPSSARSDPSLMDCTSLLVINLISSPLYYYISIG